MSWYWPTRLDTPLVEMKIYESIYGLYISSSDWVWVGKSLLIFSNLSLFLFVRDSETTLAWWSKYTEYELLLHLNLGSFSWITTIPLLHSTRLLFLRRISLTIQFTNLVQETQLKFYKVHNRFGNQACYLHSRYLLQYKIWNNIYLLST